VSTPENETVAREDEGHRPRRTWLWVAAAFGVLFVLIAGGAFWVLNTQAGTRFAVDRAVGFMAGKLQVAEVEGTLAGPLTASGIRFANPESGVDVRVSRVSVDLALRELLARRVHVLSLNVNGVDVRLSEPTKEKEEPSEPFTLDPPIDLLLDDFVLRDARVSRDGRDLFVARVAEAAGRWTGDGIAIQKFIVDSPEGNIRLTGEVEDRAGRSPEDMRTFEGRVSGGFRWKVGEAQYAGELTATSEQAKLDAQIRFSSPFAGRVNATVEQTQELPWQLTVAIPQFDPRRQMLPDSSIQSLAASLSGEGNLSFAEVRGEVAMNGKSLRIDPARVRYADRVLTIEALKLLDPTRRGTLNAAGTLRFGGEDEEAPLTADLAVDWQDVGLPKEWVGQPLSTRGNLKVAGSTVRFEAGGNLALGPPGQLADIALDIDGTQEQIAVRRFEILQQTGSLNATGTVLLKPRIGWDLAANAKTFDPGAIVAGWPGSLGFELNTKGQVLERGPDASFDLRDLNGTLRGRPIAGAGALTVNPQRVLAGNLRLSSGRSTVTVNGRSGASMDVDATLDIATLDDWAPDTSGSIAGTFHITGTWPEIAVQGNARGRGIVYHEYSVKAVDVTADVRNPQAPTGSARVHATSILAAGFEFSDVTLDASGDEKAHAVHLKATGQPVSTEVRVEGAREGPDGWAGTLQQLDLNATGISPMSLREPVQISYNPRAFSVSESCLAGEQISACATAAQDEEGELNAQYRIEHLPVGLIAALAAPELPVHIEAVVEGNGTIRRTKDGELFGEAHIASSSGRIAEVGTAPKENAEDALLTYENLRFDAQLAGETAQATVDTSVNGSGKLSGRLMLANLSGASPSMDGNVTLTLPDLSPVELFVPQVANVVGTAGANVTLAGTFAEPQITGTAELRKFGAELPLIGIKLHDGDIEAAISNGNALSLNGKVSSGGGQVALTGFTTDEGVLRIKAQGENFQAANMPGANVIVQPDLTFERSEERMLLYGQVRIPQAQVDVSKLPKQESGAQVSPDVVVIDDESPVERSRNVPLEVNVGLIIGRQPQQAGIITGQRFERKDEVTLVGYGLDAVVWGWLDVHEKPGEVTTGHGEINLSGIYKAYGQDLTIEQGRLLFAGQPINDPQLNLLATRTVDTVKAKLTVTGSARRPQLEVSADPAMSQTQALSYLVTGKPISEVGSGEGDVVQSAARSLGGAAGNLLAKNLGRRLGIDEVGVQESEEIGGSAFTVGEYLSPRLFLSYGVGLFEPGQVVTLRYRVSDRVSIEASQGTQSQRAGINFRLEK
jgi:translocation and assembly module TamB